SSQELRGHTDSVDQLRWDPTHPDHLATASCDKTVRIWDARSAKSIHKIDTTGQNINISWSPDGQSIAVGNKEDLISFIDTRTFKVQKEVPFRVEVNEISWNPAGDLFLLTTGQGSIKVFSYPAMEEVYALEAHTANCYCLEFDPRGRYLATGSADALVNLWDLEDYICVRTFGQLHWPIRTISFSFDGEFIASASEDFAIDISHVETGESVHTVTCFAAMNTVAWHPSKYLLAYAGDEQEMRNGNSTMIGNLRIFGFST
ncbi:THO complex subunit 3, partial [Lobosporangium transversale]